MSRYRIVVSEVTPIPESELAENAVSPLGAALVAQKYETEVFRQVIDGLDLGKFVRTVNAPARKSRKTKADKSAT